MEKTTEEFYVIPYHHIGKHFIPSVQVAWILKCHAFPLMLMDKDGKLLVTLLHLAITVKVYIPKQLSPSFLEHALSAIEPAKETLIHEFLNFLSKTDRDLVSSAMEDFTSVTEEDLIDFFDEQGVTKLPTKENFIEVVSDMAHKNLIQQPTYVTEVWREKLKLIKPYLKGPIGKYLLHFTFSEVKLKNWYCHQFICLFNHPPV